MPATQTDTTEPTTKPLLREFPSDKLLAWAQADKALGPESALEPTLGPKVLKQVGGVLRLSEFMIKLGVTALKHGPSEAKKPIDRAAAHLKQNGRKIAALGIVAGGAALTHYVAKNGAIDIGVLTVDPANMRTLGCLAASVAGIRIVSEYAATRPSPKKLEQLTTDILHTRTSMRNAPSNLIKRDIQVAHMDQMHEAEKMSVQLDREFDPKALETALMRKAELLRSSPAEITGLVSSLSAVTASMPVPEPNKLVTAWTEGIKGMKAYNSNLADIGR